RPSCIIERKQRTEVRFMPCGLPSELCAPSSLVLEGNGLSLDVSQVTQRLPVPAVSRRRSVRSHQSNRHWFALAANRPFPKRGCDPWRFSVLDWRPSRTYCSALRRCAAPRPLAAPQLG